MTLFEDEHFNCPCYDGEDCTFQTRTSYNQHVNDPRHNYTECTEFNCPVYFWIEKFAERMKVDIDG